MCFSILFVKFSFFFQLFSVFSFCNFSIFDFSVFSMFHFLCLYAVPSSFMCLISSMARKAATARFAPLTRSSRIGHSKDNTMSRERFITPHQPSTSSASAPPPCVELWMFKCAIVGFRSGEASVVSDADNKRMCNMKMIFAGTLAAWVSSRMAPQPHMMSDLCSPHESVMTQTVQQLYFLS